MLLTAISRSRCWLATGLLTLGALAGQAQTYAAAGRGGSLRPAGYLSTTGSQLGRTGPNADATNPGFTPTVAAVASATGAFRVSGGQFLQPDGTTFLARGVNVTPYDNYAPSLYPAVKALFSGINFIRLVTAYGNLQGGQTKPTVDQFIAAATADKVVVLVDNHTQGTVHTGSELTSVCNWYKQLATDYKNNPYVWFDTSNEPDGNYDTIAAEELAIYNAIRNTGNNNPIMMQLQGGGYTDWRAGRESTWSGMHNVGWDYHFYGFWEPHYESGASRATTQAATTANFNAGASTIQSVQSADGLMPLLIGEFGPSTSGLANTTDSNASSTLATVFGSGISWTAWALTGTTKPGGDCLYGDDEANGQLTSWGQQAAAKIAAAGTGPGGAAGLVSGGTYKLLARHSGKALDVDGGQGQVQQYTSFDNDPNQQWVVETQADGTTYKLTLAGTSNVLDVPGNSGQDGTRVQLYQDNGSPAQRWVLTPTDHGYYKLQHQGTSQVLDVPGFSQADGVALIQYEAKSSNDANQQWQLVLVSSAAQVKTSSPAKLSAAATATQAPTTEVLQAYPNPSTGPATLRLTSKQAQPVTVYVHNAQGRLVSLLGVPAQAGQTDFALPNSLPAGTYFLRATLNGHQQRFTLKVE